MKILDSNIVFIQDIVMSTFQEKQEYRLMVLYHLWWKYKTAIITSLLLLISALSFLGYKYFKLSEQNNANSTLIQKYLLTENSQYLEQILSTDSVYGLSPYHKLAKIILATKNPTADNLKFLTKTKKYAFIAHLLENDVSYANEHTQKIISEKEYIKSSSNTDSKQTSNKSEYNSNYRTILYDIASGNAVTAV